MSNEISILEVLKILYKRLGAIILVAIVFGGVAFSVSAFYIEPTYSTSATLLVKSTKGDKTENSSSVLTDINASQKLTASYMIVLTSENAMDEILNRTELQYTQSQLKKMISVSVVNDSEVLKITVQGKDKNDIVIIANALQEAAQDLLKRIVETGSVNIVDVAKYSHVVSPSIPQNTIIAALLGAVLTCFVVFIIAMMDQTIKSEDEIISKYNLTVLGSVCSFASNKKGGKKNG